MNISVYFAVIVACIMVLDKTGLAVYALFCAAVHEAGHLIVLKMMKIEVEEFSIKAFGANIRLKNNSRISYRQEILISLAGGGANLILALVNYVLWSLRIFTDYTAAIMIFSLIIAAFNLLPIGPLDGGRCLECLLLTRFQVARVQILMNVISFVLIIPLTIAGFFLVVGTGYNFSLIMAAAYLGAFLILKGRLIDRPGCYARRRLR